MPTARVALSSDLKRKGWMREGLVQSAKKSFWSPLIGNSIDNVVYQVNNENAGEGHTVVFDFDGYLSGKAIKGRDKAYGKGEIKRKFSDKITVERFRLPVDNGDKFDGKDIDDLSINQHADSRDKLSDLFQRFKDQALFDSAQGLLGQAPTHIINLVSTFDFNKLVDIEKIVKTSIGFSTGSVRNPLKPFRSDNGLPYWLFMIDSAMAAMLKKSTNYQTIVAQSDIRGRDNMIIKGVIGRIGSLLILETDNFFGSTDGTGTISLNQTNVEISGLRQKDANGVWTGQTGFSYSGALYSRGLLLGAGALQIAFGKQPDYKFQESEDFGISSESACEFWMNVHKTTLVAENSDYSAAKLNNVDFGVIAVDVKVQ